MKINYAESTEVLRQHKLRVFFSYSNSSKNEKRNKGRALYGKPPLAKDITKCIILQGERDVLATGETVCSAKDTNSRPLSRQIAFMRATDGLNDDLRTLLREHLTFRPPYVKKVKLAIEQKIEANVS